MRIGWRLSLILASLLGSGCVTYVAPGLGRAVRPIAPGGHELVVSGSAVIVENGGILLPVLEGHYARGLTERLALDIHGGDGLLTTGLRIQLYKKNDFAISLVPQLGTMLALALSDGQGSTLLLAPGAVLTAANEAGTHVSLRYVYTGYLELEPSHSSANAISQVWSVVVGKGYDTKALHLRPEIGFLVQRVGEMFLLNAVNQSETVAMFSLGLALSLRSPL